MGRRKREQLGTSGLCTVRASQEAATPAQGVQPHCSELRRLSWEQVSVLGPFFLGTAEETRREQGLLGPAPEQTLLGRRPKTAEPSWTRRPDWLQGSSRSLNASPGSQQRGNTHTPEGP